MIQGTLKFKGIKCSSTQTINSNKGIKLMYRQEVHMRNIGIIKYEILL